jgi:hypothetical protein
MERMAVTTTDIATFLEQERRGILTDAGTALARAHTPHYGLVGDEKVYERLGALFDRLVEGLAVRDLGPIVAYSEQVADERFASGYDLSEVQVAFNALEETTWTCVLAELDPSEFAQAIGSISTVLGAGKDALARRYVSLATESHVPSLDLRALFAGT